MCLIGDRREKREERRSEGEIEMGVRLVNEQVFNLKISVLVYLVK